MYNKLLWDFKIINLNLPQLVPFYYSHQITLVFFALALLLMLFSKYILPNILSIQLARFTLSDKINT